MKDFSRSLFIDHLIALGPNLDYGLDNNGDNEWQLEVIWNVSHHHINDKKWFLYWAIGPAEYENHLEIIETWHPIALGYSK